MKIMLVTNNCPPVIDGIGDYTYLLSKRLLSLGVDVEVACRQRVEIINAKKDNKNFDHIIPFIKRWNIVENVRLIKLARTRKVDIILFQYEPYTFSKLGVPVHLLVIPLLGRLYKIKTAFFFHEVAIQLKWNKPNWFLRGIAQRLLARILCVMSHKVFVSIKYYYKAFLSPVKATIIPIPSNFLQPASFELANATKEKEAKEQFTLISFLNRASEPLFIAIQNLIAKGFKIHLSLIGSTRNNHMVQARKFIRQYHLYEVVSICEKSEQEDIIKLMANSDIYIQLEKVENGYGGISAKSGAFAFAMSMGLPSIATKGNLTDESIHKDKFNVCFVPYEDAVSLENCIVFLIKDKDTRTQLGRNILATYKQQFSWELVVKKINEELEIMMAV